MKSVFYSTIFVFFTAASCVSTSDLIQTHRDNSYTQNMNAAKAPHQVVKNGSVISATNNPTLVTAAPVKSETILPQTSNQPMDLHIVAPPQESFFKLFSKETIKKEKSSERYPVDAKKIGAILPLSGKNASVGQRALAALRLGLGLTESSPALSLILYDSQGSPEIAALGVKKLLKDDNVIAIFGGLAAKEAMAISEKADFFEVPFFTFSQKSGLTDNSDFTFRNAVTAEMQIDKLADFSFQKLSLKRYAILYPNDAYGVEFANKFWDQVLARGGVITAAQAYDPKNSDLNVYIQKMVGTYYNDDRPEELKIKLDELKEKNAKKTTAGVKKNSRESEVQESLLEPIVDFDAIFIPDSGRALGQAMAFLKSNNVQNLTYLGTNLWNTPDLIRRAGAHNQHLYFVDTESAAAQNMTQNTNSDFYKKYFSMSQEEPQLLEAQTYEAAKIVREQLSFGATGREALAYQLRSLGRRNGAYGEIRMNNNKELERDLTILTVDQGNIRKY